MKRLTKKLNQPYENICGLDYVYTSDSRLTPSFASVEQKLGQLEDIEEELGVELITLFNALKDGLWYRLQNGKLRYMKVTLALLSEGWVLAEFYPKPTNVAIQLYNPMHRYGIEWALTKEELE